MRHRVREETERKRQRQRGGDPKTRKEIQRGTQRDIERSRTLEMFDKYKRGEIDRVPPVEHEPVEDLNGGRPRTTTAIARKAQ